MIRGEEKMEGRHDGLDQSNRAPAHKRKFASV